ncbi:hypothetical protein Poli38472_001295 [Pythium oligandrum]|uniref:Bidirectional sugar transporter SWEET n=1 Tax=Pythium oligandrum TaxID=41045 RepID=A0A8K1CTU2_PYTOL|nr:hypothetical protein Poli38472_001295 [Pythium oligandrum]|eukprot:TMW69139.1 hypothetical protein Poli38472_001295 [Pythium oligandrum]
MASWQSAENAFYMAYFLGLRAVPVVAVGSSIASAVSPWHTVKVIQRAGHTMQYSFAPFFFFFVQSVMNTLYGYTTANPVVKYTAALSVVMGTYYINVYCRHAPNKARPLRWLVTALTLISMLAMVAMSKSPKESQLLIGVPGNILALLTSASPLLQIKTILKTRDASCLPLGMAVMNVVAGGIWMLYGMLLQDKLVILPNMFALTMGLIQGALIVSFPSKLQTAQEYGFAGKTGSANSPSVKSSDVSNGTASIFKDPQE